MDRTSHVRVFTSITPYPGCPEHSVGLRGSVWDTKYTRPSATRAPARARDGEPRDAEREEYTFLC